MKEAAEDGAKGSTKFQICQISKFFEGGRNYGVNGFLTGKHESRKYMKEAAEDGGKGNTKFPNLPDF